MKTIHRALCLFLTAILCICASVSGTLALTAGAADAENTDSVQSSAADSSATDSTSADNTSSGSAGGTADSGSASAAAAYPASLIASWPAGPVLQGTAGLLMDARTGTVLFSQNGDERLYPASITKLMTALLTLENASLSDVVTFSANAVYSIEADSSNIAASEGEQLTVEQCMYALLLESANEVANGLAEHIAGSTEAFAEMMNERAAQLGCTNTHFVNAHGLHDDNHYTTCHDMALIMQALIDNETFIQICSAAKYTIPATNKQPEPRYLRQAHKMLTNSEYAYEGTVAGKTGYTPEAGNTLVTYAVRGDTELIAVSMHTNWTHYDDTIAMFDYGFGCFTACDMSETGRNPQNDETLSSLQSVFDTSSATFAVKENSWVILPNNISSDDLEETLTLSTDISSDTVARITYSYQGAVLGSGELLLVDDGEAHFDFEEHETTAAAYEGPSEDGPWFINGWILAAIILCILAILFLAVFINRCLRKRRSVIKARSGRRRRRKARRRRKNQT